MLEKEGLGRMPISCLESTNMSSRDLGPTIKGSGILGHVRKKRENRMSRELRWSLAEF